MKTLKQLAIDISGQTVLEMCGVPTGASMILWAMAKDTCYKLYVVFSMNLGDAKKHFHM